MIRELTICFLLLAALLGPGLYLMSQLPTQNEIKQMIQNETKQKGLQNGLHH